MVFALIFETLCMYVALLKSQTLCIVLSTHHGRYGRYLIGTDVCAMQSLKIDVVIPKMVCLMDDLCVPWN